jgi:hypothetical protein
VITEVYQWYGYISSEDIYIHRNKLIVVQDSVVSVYDTQTGNLLRKIDIGLGLLDYNYERIKHAVSGNFIVLARSGYPYIRCFDLTMDGQSATFPLGIDSQIRSLDFEYNEREAYLVIEQGGEFEKRFLLFSSKNPFEEAADGSLKASPRDNVLLIPKEERSLVPPEIIPSVSQEKVSSTLPHCLEAFFSFIWKCIGNCFFAT